MQSSPNELSFLPDDYLERKAQRRTNAICAVLFLVVMCCIGSAFTYTERSVGDVEREHDAVEKQYTDAAKRIKLVQELQEKQRRMAQQWELASSLLEKVPRSNLLADITNDLPAGVSLLDLTMESKARNGAAANAASAAPKLTFEQKRGGSSGAAGPATVTGPKVYDVYVKISGMAFTDVQVGDFIRKLNQSKLLKDVNLIISDEFKQGDSQLRKFQLEAQLDPNAEVTPGMDVKPMRTAAIELKEK